MEDAMASIRVASGAAFMKFAEFTDNHIFLVALFTFALVFSPMWMRLLTSDSGRPTPKQPFLDPVQWQQLPLVKKGTLSHNSRRFRRALTGREFPIARFALPHPEQQLGLPIGQHITLRAPPRAGDEGPPLLRPYTPVSDDDQRGFVDFVIKVYPEGKMSQYMDKMVLGDCLDFKGPKGRFTYQRNSKRAIGMVAGGTGITPMYQVINAILRDPADSTELSLVSANVGEDDILLRNELDTLAATHANFRVYYVLNNPPAGWSGGVGFVTPQIIKEQLPVPADDMMVLRCGPLAMNKAVEAHLDALGYAKESQFQF